MNRLPFFVALVMLGCSGDVVHESSPELVGMRADELRDCADFDASFADCVESIGVVLASTEEVSAHVPPPFVPVGIWTPVTPLVVRTADCANISVDGKRGGSGSVVQIGAVIVPPDGTGDINNYTLRYYSDNRKLADALGRAGLAVTRVQIGYDFTNADAASSLDVTVTARGDSRLRLSGSVAPASAPAGSFLANWWVDTRRGALKLSTNVPEIAIGSAALVLELRAHGALDELFGGTSITFQLLEQFNAFAAAEMHVSQGD